MFVIRLSFLVDVIYWCKRKMGNPIGFPIFLLPNIKKRDSNIEYHRGLSLKLTVPVEISGLSPSDVGLNFVRCTALLYC
jgi:hypothetical protein